MRNFSLAAISHPSAASLAAFVSAEWYSRLGTHWSCAVSGIALQEDLKCALRWSLNAAAQLTERTDAAARPPIWLIGEGRSGTTWVSTLINHDLSRKELFEPFHPYYRPARSLMSAHQYLRAGDAHPLARYVDRVFAARWICNRTLPTALGKQYRGLLVKDVFANLLARWVWQRTPTSKVVLLLRNPFSVALSKYKTRHWHWLTDPKKLLQQPQLRSDFLAPFEDILSDPDADYVERQVAIWCVSNMVPLRLFAPGELYILFYEALYEQPEEELAALFEYLGEPDPTNAVENAMERFSTMSRVSTRDLTADRSISPVSSWQRELTGRQRARGQEILQSFAMEQFYSPDGRPMKEGVSVFRRDAEWRSNSSTRRPSERSVSADEQPPRQCVT